MTPLYFLHIPKTAGFYVENTLMAALNEGCKRSNIDTRHNLIYGNQGWRPVQKDTYIFSIARNPINRTISHYVYFNPEVITFPAEELKPTMFRYIEQNEFLHNYQAKFIASQHEKMDEVLDSPQMDQGTELFNERAARINKLVKSENINPTTINDLYTEFCDVLGVTEPMQLTFPDYRVFEHISMLTRGIRDSLTVSEVSYLTDINSLDFEFYEAAL